MTAKIITGDLLTSDAQYIVHQTNCTSHGVAGLAHYIFKKYPYADIYSQRKRDNIIHVPGKIYIEGNGKDRRLIINAMGQFWPGPPQTNILEGMPIKETEALRIRYFGDCLKEIANIGGVKSVAFPWRIGCGLAQGNWDNYKELINVFARESKLDVSIVKRPEDV